MKLRELQTLLDSQPSVSGSTFLVGTLYLISWILAVFFFILGIGLLLESAFHFKIFLDWLSRNLNIVLNEEQRWKIATSFGIISLILALIFVGVIILCRMVLKRNHFIIQLEDWLYLNVADIKKNSIKRRKK